jgi:hypothetical protein
MNLSQKFRQKLADMKREMASNVLLAYRPVNIFAMGIYQLSFFIDEATS